jgi:spoIIIJ-associated protein
MTASWNYTGKTVNEATEQALRDLGINLEDVEIQVISPGREGIMGLGGKLAEIEVSLIDAKDTAAKAKPSKRREREPRHKKSAVNGYDEAENEFSKPAKPRPFEGLTEHDAELEKVTSETLSHLLNLMGLTTEIYLRDELDDGHIVFEIEGEDAGSLIGSYGETLQALQSILRLVLRQKIGRKAYVALDIEDYRERRLQTLKKLARRAAQDAIKSHRAQDLPPMRPSDRRIVHMQLADDNRVATSSEGAGKERRVVVTYRGGK